MFTDEGKRSEAVCCKFYLLISFFFRFQIEAAEQTQPLNNIFCTHTAHIKVSVMPWLFSSFGALARFQASKVHR